MTAQNAPNPELKEIEDVAGLPRVLIIGDSISMGYTIPVRELLKGKANVHRPLANGGPTINGTAHIDEWLGSGKWDVIHFNWGLHDLKINDDGTRQVPIDKYEQNLRELVARMRQTGAKLIWASTTPVPDAAMKIPRKTSDVPAYNKVAAKVMQEYGIPTDDLYTFALPRLSTIQLPANVHYTPDGYKALAGEVAASIERALASK